MKKILILTIIGAMLFHFNAFAASPPSVVADGALLIDTTTDKILFEKNKDTKFYPASTTKVMTALLVLEKLKLDDKIIIGKKPPFTEGSKIYVIEGEEFTVEQLLYALLIESANDVASAFAEHIAGSDEAFGRLMTERAKELGCNNTNFANPHGLYNPEHYTTAHDLYLITREAMKHEMYRTIVGTKLYVVEPTNKQPEKRYLHSNNRLMFNPRYLVEGANGVKTGYTTESGHSLVGTVYRDDTKLMVVLLHDRKPGLWEDAYALLNYGLDSYKTSKIVSAGDVITSLKMPNSDIEVPLVAESDLYYTHDSGSDPSAHSDIKITDYLNGHIVKGQDMGNVTYSIDGSQIGAVNLLSAEELASTMLYNYKKDKYGNIKRVYSSWLLLPAVSFLMMFLLAAGARMTKRKRSNT